MNLTPDLIVYWQIGFLKLNATIVFTWLVMLVLAVGSILITRNLSNNLQRSRWQNALEVVVITINKQITAPQLVDLIDGYLEGAGHNLLGVWITWPAD